MQLHDALRVGQPLLGAWLQTDSRLGAEIAGRSGYDWVGIDTQHGIISYDGMIQMLQAIGVSGTPVIVRVSANDSGEIARALDAGADGVIVPLVEDADGARTAVGACRYAPEGTRSWGPTRAALGVSGFTPKYGNDHAVCIVQLESTRAVDNLTEILEVPGVDAIYIGPNDLAISAGLAPDLTVQNPEHRRLVDVIVTGAKQHSIATGTHVPTPAHAGEWSSQGFSLLAVYLELPTLVHAARNALQLARNSLERL